MYRSSCALERCPYAASGRHSAVSDHVECSQDTEPSRRPGHREAVIKRSPPHANGLCLSHGTRPYRSPALCGIAVGCRSTRELSLRKASFPDSPAPDGIERHPGLHLWKPQFRALNENRGYLWALVYTDHLKTISDQADQMKESDDLDLESRLIALLNRSGKSQFTSETRMHGREALTSCAPF